MCVTFRKIEDALSFKLNVIHLGICDLDFLVF